MVKNLPTVERSTKIRFGKNCLENQAENTIVFNATDEELNANNAGAVYLSPIRNRTDYSDRQIVLLMYNRETKEITESGEAATDIIETSLQGATNFGNVTSNTVVFTGLDGGRGISLMTSNAVGIANLAPGNHTLSVGSNLYVDDEGSNVLVVSGNVAILKDLVIEGNLAVYGNTTVLVTENISIKDAMIELGRNNTSGDTTLDLGLIMNRPSPESNIVVGFRESTDEVVIAYTNSKPTDKIFTPLTSQDIDLHVYGRILTEANVGIVNTNPIHTLDIGSNLYVDDLASNIFVARGNVDLLGDVTITENVYIGEDIFVTGNAYITGNVSVTEELTVSDNVYADKDLEVVGNVYVDGNVVAYKDLSITGNAYITGNVSVTEELTVSNNVYADKDLEVVGNVYVDGNVVAYKDFTLTGNAYVSGNVSITEELTVSNNVYADKDLEVVGNVYVDGNVVASKDFTLTGNAYVSGNVNITNQLTVSDNVYVTGNVQVTEALIVSGNTHLEGDNIFVTHTMNFLDPKTAIVTDQISNVQIRVGQLENVSNLASNPIADQVFMYDGNQWMNTFPNHSFLTIKNAETTATMVSGNAVYISGYQNENLALVKLAKADSTATMPAIGVIYGDDIAPAAEGLAVAYGKVNQMNTNGYQVGKTLYVSNVYAGYLTTVKPCDDQDANPDLIQNVGVVTRQNPTHGAMFVTGIGRANDIPNARLVTSNSYTTDLKYVYVNYANNDLRKIDPMKLPTKLQPLAHVVNTGNAVANAITIRGLNVTAADGFDGNVVVGGDVSISGLTNQFFPYIGQNDKYLRDSKMFQNGDNVIVLDTDVQVSGNLLVQGNTFEVSTGDLIVQDRIIDIANNNVDHTSDIGILMEHPGYNIGIIHHGDHPHTLSLGYTQNGFADTHILRDVGNVMTVDIHGNLLTQNSLVVNENIHVIDGGLGINVGDASDSDTLGTKKLYVDGDIQIGKVANLFVDVSKSRVGINTTTPEADLHVIGNVFVTSNITTSSNVIITGDAVATSKTTGALQVTGGVGIQGDVYATNGNFSGDVDAVNGTFTGDVDAVNITSTGTVKGSTVTATNLYGTLSGSNTAAVTDLTATGTVKGPTVTATNLYGTLSGSNTASVTDLTATGTVRGVTLTGDEVYGALTGSNTASVTDLTATGTIKGPTVTATNLYGTLSGSNTASVTDLTATGTVRGVTLTGTEVYGALTGSNTASVTDLTATGTVKGPTVTATNLYGTLSGSNTASVTDLTATGTVRGVTLTGTEVYGALTGSNTASVTDLTATGTVRGVTLTGTEVYGALTGSNTAAVTDLTATGTVRGATLTGTNLYGPIVGSNTASVTDLTATGTVRGVTLTGTEVYGALTGSNTASVTDLTVSGTVNVTDTTDATSTITGALKVAGGISTQVDLYASNVYTTGGLITNTAGVTKKTYAFSGDLTSGQTIGNSTIKITFSNHVFYAKIVAHLVESDDEVSTLSFECGGGHWTGGTPLTIAKGPVSIFGSTSTNPWDPSITATTTTVAFKPTTNMAVAGHYNVFIEYISQHASGVVAKITEGTTDVITFNY